MTKRTYALSLLPLLAAAACGASDATPPQAPSSPATPLASAPSSGATSVIAPSTGAAVDVQKKTITDCFAALNAHDAAKMFALYAPDSVVASPGEGGWREAKAADTKAMLEGFFAAFPDLKFAIVRAFVRPEVAVVEWVSNGTNTGPFRGKPATGKKTGVRGANVFWIDASGRIAREEAYWDHATIAQQLGMMPGQPRPVPDLPASPEWVVASNTPDEAKLVSTLESTGWPTAWSKHDRAMYEASIKDESTHFEIASPMDFKGKAALMNEFAMYMSALPDTSIKTPAGWAFGKYVVVKFEVDGTMKGNLGPFAPTNKAFVLHGLDVDEMADGKYVNAWSYSNGMELLDQVGVLHKH